MSWSQSGTPTGGPTPDADTFIGGSGEDIGIDGGLGDDSLVGNLGSDTIEGGGGFDFIYGGELVFTVPDPGNLLTDTEDGGWIFGAEGNDTIQMTLAGTFSTPLDIPNARIFAGAGNDLVELSGNASGFDPDVYGGTNDDTLIGTDVFSSLYGDEENDSLVGGSAGELLVGGADNDTVDGGGGDDTIYGDDIFDGETGNDSLNGGAGNDTIFGGAGDDTINGGSLGWDSMIGGEGINTLDFSDANGPVAFHLAQREVFEDGNPTTAWPDTVDGLGNPIKDPEYIEGFTVAYGSQFSDGFMAGSEEGDSIFGQDGNDVIFGNTGDDSLLGERDDDTIVGEEGNDLLIGGDGNDYLVGSRADLNTFIPENGTDPAGNDTIEGGAGSDTAAGGAGDDVITDEADGGLFLGGEGNDSIVITAEGSGIAQALGDAGDDTILAPGIGLGEPLSGDLLGVSLDGGSGDDSIVGSDAADLLFGGLDDDTITGGSSDDTVDAGDGQDAVIWRIGDGSDSLVGGDGFDVLDLEGWTPGGNATWSFTISGVDTIYTHLPTASVINAREFESITCFAPGTHILTARGEVPVERLRAGDLVVAPGRGAPLKPVRWVGHTRVDIAHHRDKRKVAPVVIRAGALGAGVPAHDLRVSPEHAFLLQGRLVPAHLLVNGTTILQETWHRAMTYWHVELEQHGVLVAEGALAESYFDDGNRHLFDNNVFAVHADFSAQRNGGRYAAEAFAPPVLDADDPALARIRAALPGEVAAARSA